MRPRNVTASVEMFSVRTPTLPPATHTTSYALGTRQVLLIEPSTPYDDERQAWLAWARGLSSRGRVAIALAATHHHVDHVSGAAFLARELGLPLWVHEATKTRIEVPVGRTLEEGEEIVLDGPSPERWRVLHTPGHAPGHVCFHDERRGVLLAGDMVASVGTILIAPSDGGDMRTYLEQLARLEALDLRLALPAHGDPIDAPRAMFRQYIDHRAMREQRIVDALRLAPLELGELVANLYADVSPAVWPIAQESLRAHLAKLVTEGRVRVTDDGAFRLLDA